MLTLSPRDKEMLGAAAAVEHLLVAG